MEPPLILIFTDLDGCLLDEETYDWSPAAPLLRELAELPAPVIFVSSKTVTEVQHLRDEMGVEDPYSAENGAIVVVPGEAVSVPGRPASELMTALLQIATATGAGVTPLSDMSRNQAWKHTGLSGSALERAMERRYSQPFLLIEGDLEALREEADRRELRIVSGKRFHHLVGRHDKGDAVRILRERFPGVAAIGVGDSCNDLPMLSGVDLPVFLGEDRPAGLPTDTQFVNETGPRAWEEGIRAALQALSISLQT